MTQGESPELTEKRKEAAWWRAPLRYRVFNLVTEGRSVEEIVEELQVGKVNVTGIIRHPFFLKKFQAYLFDGAVSKAVIKIQLMHELWKNLRGKTSDPDNRSLLNQFVRLLSEKDVKGVISPEFLALIVSVKKDSEKMSQEEKAEKIRQELDYEEVDFEEEEPKVLPDGQSNPNLRVDIQESAQDKQGAAD